MKIKLISHIISISITALILLGCERNSSVVQVDANRNSPVEFSLQFPNNKYETVGTSASKQNIDLVTIYIDGEGMDDPITKDMTISGSSASTSVELPLGDKDFYVLASVKDGSLAPFDLFEGYNFVNLTANTSTVSISLENMIQNEQTMAWHDGSFEDFLSTTESSIFAARFDISSIGSVYFKSISYNLQWSGNSGDYRIIIYDNSSNIRFRSNPLQAQNDGLVSWNLVWDPPLEGKFTNEFTAGIEYVSTNRWPEIGYDTNAPSQSSFWFDNSASQWFFMSDGDFAISAVVQTKDGQELILKPAGKMPAESTRSAQVSDLK